MRLAFLDSIYRPVINESRPSTALVAVCAEFLVSSINEFVSNTGIKQAFIGLILLPIIGNAAEHVTAVTVAAKNKMDLAIGVAVGSSIQIALSLSQSVLLGPSNISS